ncbi:winged helix-turn-helix domain-containing protein [Streptomyces indicus]|uniref:Regulatory protein, gntR family n=1 Tax=Streptomyces indicus TaxID=417292 RepID=A0A1G9F218_9ACTN|nr:winged helix-turn-helix domain-containing protein [Streptomyces indicus]SDK82489.1 regulatory protein, gntR family [Streptomyces indicus]
MTVADSDPRPKKVQIADALRDEIKAGKPTEGQKLDSLRDLADRFKVTTVTVGQGLQILMDEGLIFSVPNRGYFVQPAGAEAAGASGNVGAVITALQSELRELAARVAKLEERADHTGSA